MNKTLLIKNARLADGNLLNILIRNERIGAMGTDLYPSDEILDAQERLVLPGMIDVHAHVRDMELSYKEDWLTGSMAAAAGGVTTIFDMPNTKPPTFDQASLEEKRKAAAKSLVNYGFNFGVKKDNLSDIKQVANIAAIKMFMAESSSGRVVKGTSLVEEVFSLAKEIGKPVIVHSELQSCVENFSRKYEPVIENHNNIRNRECAIRSTQLLLEIAGAVGNSLYLAHISTKEEIDLIREAKSAGMDHIYCEITPHHLFINEKVLKTAGNYGKVNPPLRTEQDNEALHEAILDGTADTIGSDHAPHAVHEKHLDYSRAPSGFPGFETTLPLLLNEYNQNRLTLEQIIRLTSLNPARIFRIRNRGELTEGHYADLAIVNPDEEWQIDGGLFHSKAKYTPYQNMKVFGKVVTTIVNGHVLFNKGKFDKKQGKEVEFR